MATEQFNTGLAAIFIGLLKDSQSDVSYDYVIPVYTAFTQSLDNLTTDDCLQRKFIALVRTKEGVRNCIRDKDIVSLRDILSSVCPPDIVDQIGEILASFDAPALFKPDTAKKFWKRVKKLVRLSGLERVVYDDEEEEAAATETPVTSSAREERVHRFNLAYRDFLSTLRDGFPPDKQDDDNDGVLEVFDGVVSQDPHAVIKAFKEVLLPLVPEIAKAVQNGQERGVLAVLDPYFGEDSAWFRRLPIVEKLPIEKYWAEQMGVKESKEAIMKCLGDLAMCMSGIDALLYSPIVDTLRKKVIQIMQRDKITSLSPSNILNFVMELLHEIPAATGGKISSDDVRQLLMNTMAGRNDVPKSFTEVFSPDMLDEDCLDVVSTLPGIGAALAPIIGDTEALKTGITGAPAFGAVEHPAWLDRENPSEQ